LGVWLAGRGMNCERLTGALQRGKAPVNNRMHLFSTANYIKLVLLTSSLFYSCKQKPRETPAHLPLDVSITYLESVKLSQLIEKDFVYLPLASDTNALIGSVSRLILKDSAIFIFDASLAKRGYSFDMSGKENFCFGKTGSGPGEYTLPTDMAVSDNNIIIFDQDNFSVLYYNKTGEFLYETHVGYWLREFIPFSGDRFLGYTPTDYSPDGLEEAFVLRLLSADLQQTEKGFFPYEELLDDADFGGNIAYYKGIYSYAKPLLGEIYALDQQGKIRLRYKIDFAPHNWPVDIRTLKDDQERAEALLFGGGIMSIIHAMLENDQYFVFQTVMVAPEAASGKISGDDYWWCIYNKTTNKCYAVHRVVNDIDGGAFTFPDATYLGRFVSILRAEALLESRPEKKIMADDDTSLHVSLQQLADTLKPYSNPVLMFFTLKDNLTL